MNRPLNSLSVMYIQIIKFDSWVAYARTGVVVSALTHFINPMFIKAKGSVSFVFTLVLVEVLKCVDLSCLFCSKLLKTKTFYIFFWSFSGKKLRFFPPSCVHKDKICLLLLSDCHIRNKTCYKYNITIKYLFLLNKDCKNNKRSKFPIFRDTCISYILIQLSYHI